MRDLLSTVSACVLLMGCQQASEIKAVETVKDVGPVIAKGSNASYEQPNIVILLADDLGCCLLYTSPSPRDATLSRMPSSA